MQAPATAQGPEQLIAGDKPADDEMMFDSYGNNNTGYFQHQHQPQDHHRDSNSSTTEGLGFDQLNTAALGAQFDNAAFNNDHAFAQSHQRRLATQTAPVHSSAQPLHPQVLDNRLNWTDGQVGRGQGNNGFFDSHNAGVFHVPGAVGQPWNGGGEFLNGGLNGLVMGNSQDAFHLQGGMPFSNQFMAALNPAMDSGNLMHDMNQPAMDSGNLMHDMNRVPGLDWTESTADFAIPQTPQEIPIRSRPMKRRRQMQEEEEHVPAINNETVDVIVSAAAEKVLQEWLAFSRTTKVFPGDEHFRAFVTLTQINFETIKSWFTQKWIEGSTSSTQSSPKEDSASPLMLNNLKLASPKSERRRSATADLDEVKVEAATWVRNKRGTKCVPVSDLSTLRRDDQRPYQCLLKCPQRFEAKDDWRKHMEINYPQEGWVCDLEGRCRGKPVSHRGRVFCRKQHYWQHVEKIHPGIPRDLHIESSHFVVDSNFPRHCGFCRYKPNSWKDRNEHIAAHFAQKCDMMMWRDSWDEPDENIDSDDGDENDDNDENGNNDENDDHDEDNNNDGNADADGDSDFMSDQKSQHHNRPDSSNKGQYQKNYKGQISRQSDYLNIPKGRSASLSELSQLFMMDQMSSFAHVQTVRSLSIVPSINKVDPYARLKLLGLGPYSVVDEVQHITTGFICARKTIQTHRKAELNSLQNEVTIMKKLKHPHIVQFLATYGIGRSFSILMNPSADYDLGHYMDTHAGDKSPPNDTVVNWFSCLVSSVDYLHYQSIKHQDIKPSNILLKDQTIMLADFGISKVFTDTESTSSTTGCMTRKYCAPETARKSIRGRSADIFSLGCVFLEMSSFLIYHGEPTFKEYQEKRFIGERAYHENIESVRDWIQGLGENRKIVKDQDLQGKLNVIESMLAEEGNRRPTAVELSSSFQPRTCCSPSSAEKPRQLDPPESKTAPKPLFDTTQFSWKVEEPDSPAIQRSLPREIKLISPTASAETTPHSSRRNSHVDSHSDMQSSFISTPRTSVASLFGIKEEEKVGDECSDGFVVGSLDSGYGSESPHVRDEEPINECEPMGDDETISDETVESVLGSPDSGYGSESHPARDVEPIGNDLVGTGVRMFGDEAFPSQNLGMAYLGGWANVDNDSDLDPAPLKSNFDSTALDHPPKQADPLNDRLNQIWQLVLENESTEGLPVSNITKNKTSAVQLTVKPTWQSYEDKTDSAWIAPGKQPYISKALSEDFRTFDNVTPRDPPYGVKRLFLYKLVLLLFLPLAYPLLTVPATASGPGFLVIAFVVIGIVSFSIMECLGELVVYMALKTSFDPFVDYLTCGNDANSSSMIKASVGMAISSSLLLCTTILPIGWLLSLLAVSMLCARMHCHALTTLGTFKLTSIVLIATYAAQGIDVWNDSIVGDRSEATPSEISSTSLVFWFSVTILVVSYLNDEFFCKSSRRHIYGRELLHVILICLSTAIVTGFFEGKNPRPSTSSNSFEGLTLFDGWQHLTSLVAAQIAALNEWNNNRSLRDYAAGTTQLLFGGLIVVSMAFARFLYFIKDSLRYSMKTYKEIVKKHSNSLSVRNWGDSKLNTLKTTRRLWFDRRKSVWKYLAFWLAFCSPLCCLSSFCFTMSRPVPFMRLQGELSNPAFARTNMTSTGVFGSASKLNVISDALDLASELNVIRDALNLASEWKVIWDALDLATELKEIWAVIPMSNQRGKRAPTSQKATSDDDGTYSDHTTDRLADLSGYSGLDCESVLQFDLSTHAMNITQEISPMVIYRTYITIATDIIDHRTTASPATTRSTFTSTPVEETALDRQCHRCQRPHQIWREELFPLQCQFPQYTQQCLVVQFSS